MDSEIGLEKMLGNGSFCGAWTIGHIHLETGHQARSLPHQDKRRRLKEQINQATKKKSSRSKLRCIVKKPRTDFIANINNGSRMLKDLKNELKILYRVGTGEHPNIIQLHGIGTPSGTGNDASHTSDSENSNSNTYSTDEEDQQSGLTFLPSFLILSRIRYTMFDMISQWRDQRGLGVHQALSLDQDNTRQLWKERLTVLAQVADGLAFLHSKRIIIRDLKPDNVGMDYHGVVKIFDFGLAVHIDKKNYDVSKLYHLTGKTGTLGYMSPEVFLRKKYGFGADVYSLAIVIHQVLSLKQSFTNMSSTSYGQRVCEKGLRPSLEAGWPTKVRELLQSMWAGDPKQRLTAAAASQTLSQILQGPAQDLYPTALFSTTRWFPGSGGSKQQQQKESTFKNSDEEETCVVVTPDTKE